MKVFALGGSSSIGQAAIRVLLDAGHEVCGTFRTRVPQGLDGATWVRADVRSTADLDALSGPAEGADVLLLLPGLSLGRTLGTYEDDQVSEVVDVNFSGQFRAIQRIAPVLRTAPTSSSWVRRRASAGRVTPSTAQRRERCTPSQSRWPSPSRHARA